MQAFLEQNEANESLMDLEFWAEIKLQPDVNKSSAEQEVCHLGLQEQKQRWCGHSDSVVKCYWCSQTVFPAFFPLESVEVGYVYHVLTCVVYSLIHICIASNQFTDIKKTIIFSCHLYWNDSEFCLRCLLQNLEWSVSQREGRVWSCWLQVPSMTSCFSQLVYPHVFQAV